MASVKSSRESKYERRAMPDEDEPPVHVESAGELLIKQLVQKQTNTNITLDQQLREEKQFEHGIGFVGLDQFTAGTSSLQQFEARQQQAEREGELTVTRLRGEEGQRKTTEVFSASHPVMSNRETLNRQDWELALSVKPDSVETRLYQFAMRNASAAPRTDPRPPDHPVHHLPALEASLLKTADPQATARTFRRKRRQQLEALAEPQGVHFKASDRLHSLWDAIEPPVVLNNKPCKAETIATCKKQTLYTIKDGKIMQMDSSKKVVDDPPTKPQCKLKPSGQCFVVLQTPSVSPEVAGRVSEAEIKQMPRFKNYDRGQVSKTLFIKNLSSNVTEEDLAAVFQQFVECNERKIIFRLMTGKMRGQAFVTFTSDKNATDALEAVNGTILKGKPMVIQYGRQQS